MGRSLCPALTPHRALVAADPHDPARDRGGGHLADMLRELGATEDQQQDAWEGDIG